MQKSPRLSSQEYLEERVKKVLETASDMGATSAAASVTDEKGLNINIRKQDIEILEHTYDRSLAVQVYIGQASGSASSGDMSDEGIRSAVKAAVNIAKYTAEDPCAGLPEKEFLCEYPLELSLCHPWDISTEEAVEICKEAEKAGLDADKRIVNTEGASLTTSSGTFVLGNTLGFCHGYSFSSHTLGAGMIAEDENGMQTGGWFSSDPVPEKLEGSASIGRQAAKRACASLSARTIDTQKCPLIFENRAAQQILGVLRSAASGGSLYRKASFLVDKKGTQIFPEYVNVLEDPYIPAAYGSAPFDDEGVKPSKRHVVENGILKGYFLSCYSARKLGMKTTANASGPYNLFLTADEAHTEDDLESLLERMGTGILVTSMIGPGINIPTGDYSRGAKGFWIENGKIAYPVDGVTISGNLKDMFMNIEAVGRDFTHNSNYFNGSILIKQMQVAS